MSSSTTKKKKKKSKSTRHGDWVQKLDPNSKRYYYGNVKTMERVWEMPEDFKVAEAAAKAQATSTSTSNSTTSASPALPERPTTTPSPSDTKNEDDDNKDKDDGGDDWIEGYDPKNKRKYYVNKHTGESKWTKPLAKTEVIADDWISGRDPKTKRVYYYNKRTKETTWEKPPGYLDPKSSKQTSSNTEDAKKVIGSIDKIKPKLEPKSSKPDSSSSPSLEELKERKKKGKKKTRPPAAGKSGTMLWISGTDPKTNKIYYYNTTTKETTWTKPTEEDLNLKGTTVKASSSKHGRNSSMMDVEKSVKPGIVKQRRQSIVKGGGSPKRNGHSRQRSRAVDSASEVIRLAQLAKTLDAIPTEEDSKEEYDNGRRGRSGTTDFADMILTSPTLDNIPRSNNTVEIQYLQLLNASTKELSATLLQHRKRLGGISTAPLSDIIIALNQDGKDGKSEDVSLTPYLEGAHRRTISNLELSPEQ